MGQAWGVGFVTSINPLQVTLGEGANNPGYTWDEVRRVQQVAYEIT